MQTSSNKTITPAWNVEAALERFAGDRELLREIVGVFLETVPDMMHAVQISLQNRDVAALKESAHTLKGSVANFTITGAAVSCQELENAAKNNNLSSADPLLEELQSQIQALILDMRHAIDTGEV